MRSKLQTLVRWSRRHPIQALLLSVMIARMVAYGGTKGPAVVEEKGINLTRCDVTGAGISLAWTSEDERIEAGTTVFIIEARERPIRIGKTTVFRPANESWYEIGRTTDYELAKPGVWTDATRDIRVRTVIEGTEASE